MNALLPIHLNRTCVTNPYGQHADIFIHRFSRGYHVQYGPTRQDSDGPSADKFVKRWPQVLSLYVQFKFHYGL